MAALGTRGHRRGVPFQEVLLYPVRRGDSGREVLQEITLVVTLQQFGATFASQGAPGSWDPVSPFVNPQDAIPKAKGRPHSPLAISPLAPPPSGMRISVDQDALFRVDYAWLTARGFDPTGQDPRNFRITCQGVELPVLVEGEADGVFGPGDAIIFYGQKAELPPRAYWNGGDFTDTNVYWLLVGSSPGLRMLAVPAAPGSGYPAVTKFQSTVLAEKDDFFDVIDHFRPNGEHWFWSPLLGTYPGGPSSTRTLTFQAPHATTGASEVRLVAASLNAGEHSLRPQLNGAFPSSGSDPWIWSGKALTEAIWSFGAPISGSNALQLTVPGYPDHDDYQIPDSLQVTYWRTLASDSGVLLLATPNANATYTSSGYSAAPYILDLSRSDLATGLALPQRLTGATFTSGAASFQMALDVGVSGRKVLLSAAPGVPTSAEMGSPQDLTGPDPGADLLVVTHPDFMPSFLGNEWQRWVSRRSTTQTVRVVTVQDIFDNFSYGVFDPPAVKEFLRVVGSSWQALPKEILLVGDGTWDYKNNLLKAGFKNTVPTMAFEDLGDSTYLGRYVSDAWFADWDDDGYPDAAVGRLPVRSQTESEGLFAKMRVYEGQALAGSWYKTGLFVADKADGQGLEFEAHQNFLASTFAAPPWANQKLYYGQPPYNGSDATSFSTALRGAFPNAALANYSGHGSFSWWGYNGGSLALFNAQKVRNGNTQSDVDLLSSTWHLPFLLQGTCYSSAFAEPNSLALAEELLDRADGGSIGSAGQTTIGYVNEEQAFADTLFGLAFGRSKTRALGELVEGGRFALPSSNTRAVMGNVLLGDPSLRLRLPAPEAPITLSATGQNGAAQLTWGPAPAAAGYLVYRSSNGGGSWMRLTGTALPPSQTSYTATGLTNTVSYLFYVSTVDAEGFEGPPSPMATATPLNPNPPAVPSGLQAADAGTGDALDVRWNANTEPDLSGYTLWWGTASGVYGNSQSFGSTTTATRVGGLVLGTTYYFTVTARNTSGKVSGGASEAHGVPSATRLAIRPPAMIVDLTVTRSGGDLLLSWSKPLVDVGGASVAVTHFQLFRVVNSWDWNLDTVSTGAPNAKVVIPATGATSYTYTDTGAWGLGGNLSYLVVALTASGERSAASNPHPGPVMSLRVTRSASTGKTLLSWNAVTLAADGRTPALIDHYTVYGFYPMTTSAQHVQVASPTLLTQVPAALTPCEGSAVLCDSTAAIPLFYTVVAVDRRGNTSLY